MNIIVLDDGNEYIIVDSMEIDGEKFVFFANVTDPTDFCFRKEVIKNGEKVYSALADREEFEKIIKEFGLKYEK